MKFDQKSKLLTMIRGDSGTLTVSIVNSQGEEAEAPEMVLSIRKRLESKEYALQVPYDAETKAFTFEHKDTAELKPGNYVWDIECRKDGRVTTLGPFTCKVVGDVTREVV
ncbi:hypothetical protein [Acidaminococcus intestini]|uniref:BppU N-terminal domain-containing protein n=1 Tax=Acidaminococcus intestini (strain RyC-MR95) TaxID=568816 RepID=G4Q3W8_ACIIR|nr:hypothetical protein [Acidaminococcus intestini]AEQ23034.1 hypothetical protein Acin_1823 [Acidaminococcus intestini RyC-MR95]